MTEQQHQPHPLTRLHPVHQHLPERPAWTCRACGEQWPCPIGRMLLRREYGADRAALGVYMAAQLGDAAHDYLAHDRDVSAGELYDRFLAWL